LEFLDAKLPFAIPTPKITNILPSSDGARHPVSHGITLPGDATGGGSVNLSVHARIAQSAFFLSHVIDRVSALDPDTSSCGAAILEKKLRAFALTLLETSGRKFLCWPYTICLR
jgi:hypothetical protein